MKKLDFDSYHVVSGEYNTQTRLYLYVRKNEAQELIADGFRYLYEDRLGALCLRDSVVYRQQLKGMVPEPPFEVYKRCGDVWVLRTGPVPCSNS